MNDSDRESIRKMLAEHNTISLATCRDGEPWAASLFYANDRQLSLYFVSDYRTRHARDIEACGDVVATVNADCGSWSEVKGRVSVVQGLDRVNALRVYLAKFADVKALFEAPKSNDEQTIAERLKAANMYRLEPCWIRLIDNSKWFGYKLEVEL